MLFKELAPLPSKTFLLPALGLVTEPMLVSWGVGAAMTVEDREKRETAMKVEVLMLAVYKICTKVRCKEVTIKTVE